MRKFIKLFDAVWIELTENDINNKVFTEKIPIITVNNKHYMLFTDYINTICNHFLDITSAQKIDNIVSCRLTGSYYSSANALLNAIGLGDYEVYSGNGWTYIKFTIKLSDDEQLNKQKD